LVRKDDSSELHTEGIVENGFFSEYELPMQGYLEDYNLVCAKIKSIQYAEWDEKLKQTVVHTVKNTEENCFKHELSDLEAEYENKPISVQTKDDLFCLK
jgi:hypothetical protein